MSPGRPGPLVPVRTTVRSGTGRSGGPTRRGVVLGGMAAAGVLALLPPARAGGSVEAAVESLLAGKTRVDPDLVQIDLPERFDYGTTVPLAVSVDSPMTDADHVSRVSVFAGGNPFPEVARVAFTPANGRAAASTRIRLNEGEQEVVAVAELTDGRVSVARRRIAVAISGCSAESGGAMDANSMPRPEPRLNAPREARAGEIVQIRTMISHWMETGLRADAAGKPISRRIINRMVCTVGGEQVFAADLTPAIAANAYMTFSFRVQKSDELQFAWSEDGGAAYHARHAIEVI